MYIYMIIYFGNHLAVHSTANRRAAYTHEPNCLYQVGVNVPRHIHMCTHVLFYMCVYVYIYIHTCMIIYKHIASKEEDSNITDASQKVIIYHSGRNSPNHCAIVRSNQARPGTFLSGLRCISENGQHGKSMATDY